MNDAKANHFNLNIRCYDMLIKSYVLPHSVCTFCRPVRPSETSPFRLTFLQLWISKSYEPIGGKLLYQWGMREIANHNLLTDSNKKLARFFYECFYLYSSRTCQVRSMYPIGLCNHAVRNLNPIYWSVIIQNVIHLNCR